LNFILYFVYFLLQLVFLMRIIIFITSFLVFSVSCKGQSKWTLYNDSCFQKVKFFYDSCTRITSSKQITKTKFKIDKKLVKLINRLYNDDNFTLTELKKITAGYINKTIAQKKDGEIVNMEFDANQEGNLYLSVKGVVENGILKWKEIYIATKTKVLCNSDYMYANALDFLYLYRFLKWANFPMNFMPYHANLSILRVIEK